jgi:MmyB-like transcription regulator ligand binding domain
LGPAHDVRIHVTGTKRLHHPVVGDLDLFYESFPAPDQDQSLLIYIDEPGTTSHDAVRLLASYAATGDHPDVLLGDPGFGGKVLLRG